MYYDHLHRPQRDFHPAPWGGWYYERRTTTTNNTQPVAAPIDEERIRRIVREEIAKLPIRFDVPDTPPEA